LSLIDFHNSTDLSGAKLQTMCVDALHGWNVGGLIVRVRYSRGADFSGTCIYVDRRIYINLGRHLVYPYGMRTNLAKVKTVGRGWRRPIYVVELKTAYQLALFIFLHEIYHLLVYRAGRNTRQKESMCDRFAARYLVDHLGVAVRTERGVRVPREDWDFQDLDGFVSSSRRRRVARRPLVSSEVRLSDELGRR
jgi:hypothetical protein